ncbi:hypothetical protein C8J57DRAFT_1064952, partial [Mycena rebaudengoi]
SSVKMNGWDVVILSGQWTARRYSKHDAWTPGPMLVAEPARTSLNLNRTRLLNLSETVIKSFIFNQLQLIETQPEARRPLVVQVCGRTRLNVRFALECLVGNEWNLERAIANFNQVKVRFSLAQTRQTSD